MGAFNVDLYLGIDLSTQSCKGVLMSDTLQVVGNAVVQFDNDLPQYGTKNGVLLKGNGVVVSPTLMVVSFRMHTCIVGRSDRSAVSATFRIGLPPLRCCHGEAEVMRRFDPFL